MGYEVRWIDNWEIGRLLEYEPKLLKNIISISLHKSS